MPELTVHFAPASPHADCVCIVDVLRFTSSAAYALARGARHILPCATVEEARVAHRRRPSALLAGERNGVKPAGFDLGNSPLEFTRAAVQGRDIIWTTTNGTTAVALACGEPAAIPVPRPFPVSTEPPPSSGASRDLVLASYVNLSAVVAALETELRVGASVAIACSGREGGFALEDAACAGRLVRRLHAALGDALILNDDARASACIDEAYGEDFARLFRDAQHGRTLRELGFGADLRACSAVDTLSIVPRWRDGRFVAG